MFEQSILIDHANGKRTGALALSLTVQALAVALLLLIPLIYNDRLPDVRPWTSLTLPPIALPPAPEPVAKPAISESNTPSLQPRPAFHLPVSTRAPRGPVVVDLTMPSFDDASAIAVPGAFGPTALPSQIAVAPPPAAISRTADKPRLVGGDVQAAKIVKKIMPVYPLPAKLARISGTVRLVGIIAKDGTIQRLEVESGNPLLVRAAIDAVRQWVYRPTLLNGEAIEVIAPIEVIFTLQ